MFPVQRFSLIVAPVVMFETSMILTLTDYALHRTGKIHGTSCCFGRSASADQPTTEHDPMMWDGLTAEFMNHLDEVNADLVASGREKIGN